MPRAARTIFTFCARVNGRVAAVPTLLGVAFPSVALGAAGADGFLPRTMPMPEAIITMAKIVMTTMPGSKAVSCPPAKAPSIASPPKTTPVPHRTFPFLCPRSRCSLVGRACRNVENKLVIPTMNREPVMESWVGQPAM